MAEKTLKTRFKLRYDTLANWTKNNPVLLAGEVAIATIPTAAPASKQLPPVMIKVGDGASKFSELEWMSALAADVYPWAKAASKPSYDYSEISNAPTIPTVGNGKITIKQNNKEVGSFTVNQTDGTTISLTDTNTDTNTQYQLVLSGHTLKLQSKEKGAAAWSDVSGQSFTLPDNNTTYAFAEGTTNGAFSVTPSGGSAQSVKVHGLGNAAYKGVASSVTEAGTDLPSSAAVHSYVVNAINAVKQFQYEVVSTLPTASASTMGKIYLVAHAHGTQDGYDEFITLESGTATKTYSWEKIGNTDIDLTNYVKTLSGTANSGVVTNITKSGNTLTVTSKSLATSAPSASGSTLSFIDSVSQAADGKITATKKNISDVTDSAHGLMTAAMKKKLDSIAEGANAYELPIASSDAIGGVKPGTTSGKTYGVAVADDGSMTVTVPWTDNNTTYSAGIHISIDANHKISAAWPTSSDSGYAGINKTGTVTNVSTTANNGLKVTNGSTTPVVDIDDSVVFILDGGSSTAQV